MKNTIFISQGVIQIFVGLGAVVCGAVMIVVPSGESLQLPLDLLNGTSFENFIIPGIILFLINGIGQIISGILTFRRHRLAGYVGTVFGIGLMIWIFVQVNMIGGRHILQYSYFLLGVVETALSFLIHDHLLTIRKLV